MPMPKHRGEHADRQREPPGCGSRRQQQLQRESGRAATQASAAEMPSLATAARPEALPHLSSAYRRHEHRRDRRSSGAPHELRDEVPRTGTAAREQLLPRVRAVLDVDDHRGEQRGPSIAKPWTMPAARSDLTSTACVPAGGLSRQSALHQEQDDAQRVTPSGPRTVSGSSQVCRIRCQSARQSAESPVPEDAASRVAARAPRRTRSYAHPHAGGQLEEDLLERACLLLDAVDRDVSATSSCARRARRRRAASRSSTSALAAGPSRHCRHRASAASAASGRSDLHASRAAVSAARSSSIGPWKRMPALVDDADARGHLVDLGEQVARDEHGDAVLARHAADQVAYLVDAGRVEAVGGLVEHDELRATRGAPSRSRAAASCRASSRRPCGPPRQVEPHDLEHLGDPLLGHAKQRRVRTRRFSRPVRCA